MLALIKTPTQGTLMITQSNYTAYDTPQFRKLSDDQVERLHHASLEILDRTGIRLYEIEALELLKKKGVQVEDVEKQGPHSTGLGRVGSFCRS
jgi:trimethylamine:corrinoid methyltransferase-like protein